MAVSFVKRKSCAVKRHACLSVVVALLYNDTNMALGYGEINHFFSVWISKREK
jgi:hypothetical protein